MSDIRVRFAPSPTGYLHVGGARTALFNWLFARKYKGTFVLRIEDTDRSRYHEGALKEIFDSLRWLGLDWDEGPECGGDYGSYYQSERLERYHSCANQLIEQGMAYRCFCSEERLTKLRETQEKNKSSVIGYDRACRTLSPEESAKRAAAKEPFVLRLSIPDNCSISFHDVIRGEITFDSSTQDDFVLLKTDGYPTYHLANVIDDHHMKISHVLRGDEWITSAPKHLLLYKAFGWNPPIFAHLPVILSESGGKLSKRKGAASVMDYERGGMLPQALCNFLALLGWNPGDDREIMSINDMIEAFDLQRVGAKPSVFDTKKLEWMNGQYIASEPIESLVDTLFPAFVARGWVENNDAGRTTAHSPISLMRDRARRITDLVDICEFFFVAPQNYDSSTMAKVVKTSNLTDIITTLSDKIRQLPSFTVETVEEVFHQLMETYAVGFGKVGLPARLAITGIGGGPSLYDIMVFIGQAETVSRLDRFIEERE